MDERTETVNMILRHQIMPHGRIHEYCEQGVTADYAFAVMVEQYGLGDPLPDEFVGGLGEHEEARNVSITVADETLPSGTICTYDAGTESIWTYADHVTGRFEVEREANFATKDALVDYARRRWTNEKSTERFLDRAGRPVLRSLCSVKIVCDAGDSPFAE
jgi:hypothetical protein